eukprot:GHVL01024154.1.p1 GENE.GHVL01024154.1~~GHVL01024154.1.p1  ORF type:complete len:442 (-),score=66.51 GHVL01024154.1:361-1686(-)
MNCRSSECVFGNGCGPSGWTPSFGGPMPDISWERSGFRHPDRLLRHARRQGNKESSGRSRSSAPTGLVGLNGSTHQHRPYCLSEESLHRLSIVRGNRAFSCGRRMCTMGTGPSMNDGNIYDKSGDYKPKEWQSASIPSTWEVQQEVPAPARHSSMEKEATEKPSTLKQSSNDRSKTVQNETSRIQVTLNAPTTTVNNSSTDIHNEQSKKNNNSLELRMAIERLNKTMQRTSALKSNQSADWLAVRDLPSSTVQHVTGILDHIINKNQHGSIQLSEQTRKTLNSIQTVNEPRVTSVNVLPPSPVMVNVQHPKSHLQYVLNERNNSCDPTIKTHTEQTNGRRSVITQIDVSTTKPNQIREDNHCFNGKSVQLSDECHIQTMVSCDKNEENYVSFPLVGNENESNSLLKDNEEEGIEPLTAQLNEAIGDVERLLSLNEKFSHYT